MKTPMPMRVYLDPLLLLDVPFVRLGLEGFPSVLLVFTDALDVIPIVFAPVANTSICPDHNINNPPQ